MMFPDTTNVQQSAALRQAAERSSASNSQYEYAYSTWSPLPPKREDLASASNPSPNRGNSSREALRTFTR